MGWERRSVVQIPPVSVLGDKSPETDVLRIRYASGVEAEPLGCSTPDPPVIVEHRANTGLKMGRLGTPPETGR